MQCKFCCVDSVVYYSMVIVRHASYGHNCSINYPASSLRLLSSQLYYTVTSGRVMLQKSTQDLVITTKIQLDIYHLAVYFWQNLIQKFENISLNLQSLNLHESLVSKSHFLKTVARDSKFTFTKIILNSMYI